jgi:hypothetical protein
LRDKKTRLWHSTIMTKELSKLIVLGVLIFSTLALVGIWFYKIIRSHPPHALKEKPGRLFFPSAFFETQIIGLIVWVMVAIIVIFSDQDELGSDFVMAIALASPFFFWWWNKKTEDD